MTLTVATRFYHGQAMDLCGRQGVYPFQQYLQVRDECTTASYIDGEMRFFQYR